MNVTLSSFSELHGEVRGYWECRVLAPALLWAFPALSRASCKIDYREGSLETNRPSFWPAALKDAPLNVEMPSHSDHPGLPRERVEPFLKDLLEKSNFNRMEGGAGPTLKEWIKREYDSSK
jgi:hypothetical protein